MADGVYKDYPVILNSRGLIARPVVDEPTSKNSYLDMLNCEELYEAGVSQRLGTTIDNSAGSIGGSVYSLGEKIIGIGRLGGLNQASWRYAVTSSGKLYRKTGTTAGQYSLLSSALSGSQLTIAYYRSDISSLPYAFFADANGMIKDNGSLTAPQQMGIFQPQFPMSAQSQTPDEIILDTFQSSTYSTSGTDSFTSNTVLNSTTLTSAVTSTGIQEVTVASTSIIRLFQSFVVDTGSSQETVLVTLVTETGFIADFTKTHASGAALSEYGYSATVASSTTATVSHSFTGKPFSNWTKTLSQSDYIGFGLYIDTPADIESVTIKFDCGDGSFDSDYFMKTLGQNPMQDLINTLQSDLSSSSTTSTVVALMESMVEESVGVYGNGSGQIGYLNTGDDITNSLLFQLSDFQGVGRADFNDPVYNWDVVNGVEIKIVTNSEGTLTVKLSSLVLFGGYGPDTYAGVAYDYRFTFYNSVDGQESNPCMAMTNVNPPNDTNWVYPRRQPVLVKMNLDTYGPSGKLQDSQITHVRLYRRGGTMGDQFRRVDTIAVDISAGGTIEYIDSAQDADIQASDMMSLTNDVPVTSSLPTPVNTTLKTAITTTNSSVSVYPEDMSNISVRQQILLGSPTSIDNNFEIVIVTSISSDHFTAYVQNTHDSGEDVQATAFYGQPVTMMVQAYGKMWYAGDENNPAYLYYSNGNNPQSVGSASYVEVSTPDDYITAIAQFKGNLYVSTVKGGWWAVAPGASSGATVYPTTAKHGCVAKFGYVSTEEGVYYQSIDGIRFFAGGSSQYLTQDIEFVFQGVGDTPIAKADQSKLSQTVAAYWNNMLFFSYVGTDGDRHRLIYHTMYKRWRNDDLDCQCLNLEADSNSLLCGDSSGLIHVDRVDIPYDQSSVSNIVSASAIPFSLQTPYDFNGMPERQKNYVDFTIDANTNGQDLSLTLLFDDGQNSVSLGTLNTTKRQKVNFPVLSELGYQAYKVSMKITGNLTSRVFLYQAAIKAVPLAITRKSYDSYWMKFGIDEFKICKQLYVEYTASEDITFSVYYDGSSTAAFSFTLSSAGGVRTAQRVRLPAVAFRMMRVAASSGGDCQIWEDSSFDWKPLVNGKGYQKALMVPN